MRRNVAKKWVSALRSGRYKQIRKALKRVNNNQVESFCALGVLCDLYQKEHPENPLPEEKQSDKTKNGNEVAFGGETGILPKEVMDWAGLRNQEVFFEEKEATIPELNDKGTTFKTIADLIEKNQDKI